MIELQLQSTWASYSLSSIFPHMVDLCMSIHALYCTDFSLNVRWNAQFHGGSLDSLVDLAAMKLTNTEPLKTDNMKVYDIEDKCSSTNVHRLVVTKTFQYPDTQPLCDTKGKDYNDQR